MNLRRAYKFHVRRYAIGAMAVIGAQLAYGEFKKLDRAEPRSVKVSAVVKRPGLLKRVSRLEHRVSRMDLRIDARLAEREALR